MYGGETRTVVRRPYKLIAALCAFGAAALEAVSLGSSAWVTAEKFSLSLWHSCRQHTSAWLCVSALSHDWLVATLALVLTASVLALICTVLGCVSLCRNSSQRLYKLIAALLFFAGVCPGALPHQVPGGARSEQHLLRVQLGLRRRLGCRHLHDRGRGFNSLHVANDAEFYDVVHG
ncbi:unnamed protein product [Lampetra planeri]